jgi:PAS domain S-box-containing protein
LNNRSDSTRAAQTAAAASEEITERFAVLPLDSESLLRSAAQMSHLGCALWDEVQRVYIKVSEELAAPLGMTPEEYIATYNSYQDEITHIHQDDRERYDAHYHAYRKAPRETQFEYRIITPENRTLHIREFLRPILDGTGNLTHSIVVEQDITELKDAESQLRQAQKMEVVGQLTGGVAHDFNNLLAVILGNLELISQHFGSDSYLSELIDNAVAAAERGANFTHRLLAFSRKQELRPEPVDASRLVQNMFDLLQTTMGESTRVNIIADPRIWMSRVDRAQLESAVLNLAVNARDAMEAGGKFSIEASNFRSDGSGKRSTGLESGRDYVRIAVSDTGSGMTADVAEHAFDPFFTTKAVGKGSGLGLSMVYGFVTQSGGHVAIDTVVGRGTTVELYLPRDTTTDEDTRDDGLSGESPLGRGEVVLVVEDDASVRAFAIKVLERLGYVVRQADTAEAALEILRAYPRIDLLMTDVVLRGGMNGFDLASQVKQFRPDLPLLLVSGYTPDSFDDAREMKSTMNFIQKPFRIMELARAVRAAIDTAELPVTPMGEVREIP